MRPDSTSRINQRTASLPFSGKTPDWSKDDDASSALHQSRPVIGRALNEKKTTSLSITQSHARRTRDDNSPRLETQTSPVRDISAHENGQAGSVGFRGEFGTRVSLDLDDGVPQSYEPRDEEALPFNPSESDSACPVVKPIDKFTVDP